MANFKKNLKVIFLFVVTSALVVFFFYRKEHVVRAYECKQYTSNLDCLLRDAHDSQGRLIAFLNALKVKYKNSVVIDPGVKQMPTINQLLKMRCNNDASKITDYARATIGVENVYQVYRCLEDIKASNLQVISIRDNFFKPSPENYRDINVVFKDPVNNHLGEIQINTLALLAFKKEKGYKLFDKIRKIKFKAHQENRSPSNEEVLIMKECVTESVVGYNNAFGGSMKIDNKTLRIGVYGILINNKNEVLMVREQSGSKLIYNFPGGGVDSNEGLAEALVRECKEEIVADVKVKDLVYTTKDLYVHEDFSNCYMFGLYYTIDVQDRTHVKNGKWFPINNLPVHEMLPIDREFATFLQAGLAVPQPEPLVEASLADSY
jgi:ADP-ribose pyrophosphatase YjhB (NUDIX family)